MPTYSEWANVIAPVVDNGVPTNSQRLWDRIHEAQGRLKDYADFIARREDYSDSNFDGTVTGTPSGSTVAVVPLLNATKLTVMAAWREENNQLELAGGMIEAAFKLVEQDITQKAEAARRVYSGPESDTVKRFHAELVDGVKVPSSRFVTYLAQANTDAASHQASVQRREDYKGTAPSITFEIRKKLVESYLATSRGEMEGAAAAKKEALELIERDVVAAVEAARRDQPGEAGQLHNELPDGVKIPTARLTTFLTQAGTEAQAHQSFVQRREDYKGTAPTITFEIKKKLVESYLETSRGEAEAGTTLKKEALELIERDVVSLIEAGRREQGGDEGRLHNELPDGVKVPTARLTKYLEQAVQEAAEEQASVQRREDYAGTPPEITFEIKKKLVESYLATSRGELESASALKKEAFDLVGRDIERVVEAARRAAPGEEGRLHNELTDGVEIATSRLTTFLSQASTEAAAHQASVQRREDYNGTAPALTYEIRKKLVESYVATSRGQADMAMAFKKEAFDLIERDIVAAVEASRRELPSDEGRLHNELFDGVKIPTPRLTKYLAQASLEASTHQAFLQRREDYKGTAPAVSFEIKKKLVESYVATSRGEEDLASSCKKEAFELLERDLIALVETSRRDLTSEEGRLHNELPDGVKIPTSRFTSYLAQSLADGGNYQNFIQRREDYKGSAPSLTYEIKKKFVQSYLAASRGEPENAAAHRKEAEELIEQGIETLVESQRRDAPGDEGRLHNEITNGVEIPTPRLTAYLAQAATEAAAFQASVQRREDYAGTAPAITYEIKKKLVESYVATSRGQGDMADGLKKEAFEIVERDIQALIEASRKDHPHPRINRLHNELSGGVLVPSSRMAVLRNQAVAEASAHRKYLQREEGMASEPAKHSVIFSGFNVTTYPQYVEIKNIGTETVEMGGWKILGHGYNENITPPCVLSSNKAPNTFVFPSQFSLEANKVVRVYSGTGSTIFNNPTGNPATFSWPGMDWDSTGDIGYLHVGEDTVGVDFPTATITFGTCSMASPDPASSLSMEIEKKLVDSYLSTARGETERAAVLKKEALEIIERDVAASVQDVRRLETGDVGRLHNEIPNGLQIKSSRLAEFLAQAKDILTAQWTLVTRNEEMNLPLPQNFRWETLKVCVQALVSQSRNELEAAAATKNHALQLIEAEVKEKFVSKQRDDLEQLLASSSPDTLGSYVARLGLDLGEIGLVMPTSKLVRLINTAEEGLFTKGRFSGTTQEVRVAITDSGEIELPNEVETVIGATFDGYPVAIMSRELEYAESGPGYLGGSKTIPTVVVPPSASAITFGQALSSSVLSNGVANVPGAFSFLTPSFQPGAGTANQTVVFTPYETSKYATVEIEVAVSVGKQTPLVLSAPTASAIGFGSTLSQSTLTGGTASTPGVFSFASPTTVPALGTASQNVVFTPTDTANFSTAQLTVLVTVGKGTPVIVFSPAASDIYYGQTLADSQLTGGQTSVPGDFSFTNPNFSPGATGINLGMSITFIPDDTARFNTVSSTVSINVLKATPTVAVAPAVAPILVGQSLVSATLTGGLATFEGFAVAGTFAFSSPTTVLQNAGVFSHPVTFTPANTNLYNPTGVSVDVQVNTQVATVTTVPSAAGIVFGQTLADATLTGGVASVPGVFSFQTPATVPAAGTTGYPAVFTPTNPGVAQPAPFLVPVSVSKATPVITTPPVPSQILAGQALSASILSGGTASVPGTFFFVDEGTTPSVGTSAQPIVFIPTNTSSFNNITSSVLVSTVQSTPAITTFPVASPIVFGQTLSSSSLTGGVASTPGVFSFIFPTTAPNAGSVAQQVRFTPTNTSSFSIVDFTIPVPVSKATPTISTNPTAGTGSYGVSLASISLTGGLASVTGSFAFSSPSTVPLSGTTQQNVTFTPSNTANYNSVVFSVPVTITGQAPSILTNPTATAILFQQPLSESVLSGGSATVAGTFAFLSPATVPAGAGTTNATVRFTPSNIGQFTTVDIVVPVVVQKGSPSVTTPPTASALQNGQSLASSALTGGVAVYNGNTVPGNFAFAQPSTVPPVGTQSYPVVFNPTNSANFNSANTNASVTSTAVVRTIQLNYTQPTSVTTGGTTELPCPRANSWSYYGVTPINIASATFSGTWNVEVKLNDGLNNTYGVDVFVFNNQSAVILENGVNVTPASEPAANGTQKKYQIQRTQNTSLNITISQP